MANPRAARMTNPSLEEKQTSVDRRQSRGEKLVLKGSAPPAGAGGSHLAGLGGWRRREGGNRWYSWAGVPPPPPRGPLRTSTSAAGREPVGGNELLDSLAHP